MDITDLIELREIVSGLENDKVICLPTKRLLKYLKNLLVSNDYLDPFEKELKTYLKYRDVIFDTIKESPTSIDYYFSYCYDESDKNMEKRIRKGINRISKKFGINIKNIQFTDNFNGFINTLIISL